jgi:hypothetical protein
MSTAFVHLGAAGLPVTSAAQDPAVVIDAVPVRTAPTTQLLSK